MPINTNIPIKEFYAEIDRKIALNEQVIVNTLKYVGENCVNEARNNGSYMDQTGNLRSSIGYVVLNNGKTKFKDLKQSRSGTDKATGISNADSFIRELSSKHNTGIVLIVVAGMNYARHVESKKNVLASAELMAARLTPKLLKELGFIKIQ